MKLITSLAAIIAVASAGQIFSQPQAEHYANAADIYQSAVEYQQPGVYNVQSEAYAAHDDNAYQQQQAHSTEGHARILSYHSESDGHNYNYAYETDNGIKAHEVGQVHKGTKAEGAYSYKGDDGHMYTVQYIADEYGFRAHGAHLPTPPPIPEAILKSLEQNAKDEANGIFDDGHYQEQHEPAQNYQYSGYQQQAYQQEAYHNAPAQEVASNDAEYHH